MATMTTDSDQLEAARELVVQYLNEAHATETALVTTLQAHIAMTPRGAYRQLLEQHLDETRGHAEAIERRVADIGDGTGIVTTALGVVQTVVGQVLALSKGPIDVLRGASGEEKLLKNARDECATEALEIAHYDGIEAAALAVGDEKTARLAQRHRADEERMLAALRREIPQLATATVRERVGGEAIYDPAATGAADNVRDLAGRARGDGELPIAGYDRLNAAQVVKRLERLSQQELEAVERYERSHRNRSTVLRKVDQLRARSGRA
jgi:ferritin-like metal-binding protein YciE